MKASREDDRWVYDASLWRAWGIAGAITSAALYMVEYAPSHFGMRLEVNHPLYAIAWLAGADLIARMAARTGTARDKVILAIDATGVAALPVIIAAVPATFVIRPGSLLLALHEDYILEFKGLLSTFASMNLSAAMVEIGLVTVVAFGAAIVLLRSSTGPLRTMVVYSIVPVLLYTALAFGEVRWLGIASGAAVVALALFAWMTGPGHREPNRARTVFAVIAGALIMLPAPVDAFRSWKANQWMQPTTVADLRAIVTRDLSRFLRERTASADATILAAPTTSTLMTWFGGFRSVGTLYWENHRGIEAAAAAFAAPTPDSAHRALSSLGVTHLVFFSWNPFIDEYARLESGLGPDVTSPLIDQTFASQLVRHGQVPSWLRRIDYRLPSHPTLQRDSVWVFEVTSDSNPVAVIASRDRRTPTGVARAISPHPQGAAPARSR
jgi:hypothetical protein